MAHALHRKVLRASTRESWSHTTTVCLRSARSIPTTAFVTGTAVRSRTSRAFLLRSPRNTPLPLVMNVLLESDGTPSPNSASGGRSQRQTPTATTPSYAAVCAVITLQLTSRRNGAAGRDDHAGFSSIVRVAQCAPRHVREAAHARVSAPRDRAACQRAARGRCR